MIFFPQGNGDFSTLLWDFEHTHAHACNSRDLDGFTKNELFILLSSFSAVFVFPPLLILLFFCYYAPISTGAGTDAGTAEPNIKNITNKSPEFQVQVPGKTSFIEFYDVLKAAVIHLNTSSSPISSPSSLSLLQVVVFSRQ